MICMNEEFKNAWHNVRGISSEEMKQAALEAERLYGDIIHLPHPVSKKHPPLSMEQKAAQYSPFSALTGYEDAIEETGRLTEEKTELDEDRKAQLDHRLQLIEAGLQRRPQVSVTYFVPDPYKAGGAYVTASGTVKRIDRFRRIILMEDGTQIPVENVYDIMQVSFDQDTVCHV